MRHKHNLSHYKLLTGDMGLLYPIGLVEVLPKDTFQHSTQVFLRFSPMAAPVMHPVTVRVHHFYIPHRLTWPNPGDGTGFENFITGGPQGNDAQVVPVLATTGAANDLWDYFNLPVGLATVASALPIRAFNMVYNEYYRDQDLIAELPEDNVAVPRVAWEKDYLTTARPFVQKGPPITLPLGTRAPIMGLGKHTQTFTVADQAVYETGGVSRSYDSSMPIDFENPNSVMSYEEDPENPGFPGIYADLTSAEAIDINDFRKAFALQRFAEARARFGSRYTEYLRYLGVTPSDARLQRPEYLGGGKAQVSISEVLQTTNNAGGTPEDERFGVGDMYGHGIASLRSNAYRRTFEEHGYVMSLLSVRPKAMYLNGITRTWLRQNREDFWQKELEQIGQQEIWDGEVYADGVNERTVFGYQDRYQEYKREPNRVSSEFKNVLNYWHLGRDFTERPGLNQAFVECDASKRIFNEQTQHGLWIACQHKLAARRLVRKSGNSRIL